MKEIITKTGLQDMIWRADDERRMHLIGRALIVLFNFQTEDERDVNDTRHHNGMGFRGADARSGSITAKYYIKHKRLLDWQIDMWMKPNKKGDMRIAKYHKQLNVAANKKAAA